MSLTKFVTKPEVCARLRQLYHDPLPLPLPLITGKVLVPPASNHYSLVGTAFDYLLRFELQRRAPHAQVRPWVAEEAPRLAWDPEQQIGRIVLENPSQPGYLCCEQLAETLQAVIDRAKEAVASFLKSKSPTKAQQVELAGHAIRLAKLDPVLRARQLSADFDEAAPEDVADLLALLAIVPFGELLHARTMFLNPDFGESSRLVGGADADLISGRLLIDFKVTKGNSFKNEHLDQLLGYLILARNEKPATPAFPLVERVGIYFARQGHLWTLTAEEFVGHPRFAEVEQWFIAYAGELAAKREAARAALKSKLQGQNGKGGFRCRDEAAEATEDGAPGSQGKGSR